MQAALDSPATAAAAHRSPRPLVSIVLITLDRADLLPRCIDSLLAQTWRPLELLVVDDGSRDATPAVLDALRARAGDVAFTVLRHERNRGIGAARNTGIEAAHGDWIAFTDDDCTAAPDWIERLIAPLRADPSLAIVGGGVDEPPAPTVAQRASEGINFLGTEPRAVRSVVGCNMAFAASFLRASPFDEGARAYADEFDRCLVARAQGRGVWFEPAARVTHHHRQTVRSFLRQQWRRGAGSVWVRKKHRAGLWPRKNWIVAALLLSPLAGWFAPAPLGELAIAAAAAAFLAQTLLLDVARGKRWSAAFATLPLVLLGYLAEFGGAAAACLRGRRQ